MTKMTKNDKEDDRWEGKGEKAVVIFFSFFLLADVGGFVLMSNASARGVGRRIIPVLSNVNINYSCTTIKKGDGRRERARETLDANEMQT